VLVLSERLRGCRIPHAFGGAIAYVCYGLPRSTDDYDINIFLPESRASEVLACLEPVGVRGSSESIATIEKTGQVRLDWDDQKVDLFFAYAPFHVSVAQRVREEPVRDTAITVLSAEDLIVFKVIFNRALDWRDLERLFHQGTANLDLPYAYQWLADILGADDSRIERLRTTLAEAQELMEGE
jgi:hypothetical protein